MRKDTLGPPSKNIEDRTYNSPLYRKMLEESYQQFQDRVKGKTDRENDPRSPMSRYRKAVDKQKNVFR